MQIDRTVNLTSYPDHISFDVDYNKTIFDLYKLGLRKFFTKLYTDFGGVNRIVDDAFKTSPKSMTEVSIRIGVVCGKDIKICRDTKQRFWLFVDEVSFRIGEQGIYFNRVTLDRIQESLGLNNPYSEQVIKEEICKNVFETIQIEKPSFLDQYCRRKKEFNFDTGGFKEGNWIVVKGYVRYNIFGKDEITIGVSFTTGLISRSLFPALHNTRGMDISNEDYNWNQKQDISFLVAESICDLIFK